MAARAESAAALLSASELSRLRSELAASRGEAASVRNELSSLRSQLESARKDLSGAREEAKSKGELTDGLRVEILRLQQEVVRERTNGERLEAEARRALEAAGEIRTELERFRTASAAGDRSDQEARAALEKAKSAMDKARAEVERAQSEAQGARKEAQDSRAQGERARGEAARLKEELDASTARRAALERELSQAQTIARAALGDHEALAEAEVQLERARARVQELEREVQEVRTEARRDLELDRAEWIRKIETARGEAEAAARKASGDTTKALEQARAEAAQARADATQARNAARTIGAESEGLERRVKELEAALADGTREREESEKARLGELRCPKCRALMDEVDYTGTNVKVDRCRGCKGVFFDEGEIQQLMAEKPEERSRFWGRLWGRG